MPVNFNSRLIDALPEEMVQAQRAFCYGDALFESIRVFGSEIPLLERHWSRLSVGMAALGFELPEDWNATFFRREIRRISPENARARLSVWRSPSGLYTPENDTPQFLITAQPLGSNTFEWLEPGITLGMSESVRLPVDTYSNFKTLNASRYVAAGSEAKRRGWDDVLILNMYDRICEATSSNVFWWDNDLLCTIPLREGCVAGVQRALLLEIAGAAGFAIQEKSATFAALQRANEVFLTNAIRGFIPVRNFAGRLLQQSKTKALFEDVFVRFYAGLFQESQGL